MFRLLILLLVIGLQSATAATFTVISTADTSGSSCGANSDSASVATYAVCASRLSLPRLLQRAWAVCSRQSRT